MISQFNGASTEYVQNNKPAQIPVGSYVARIHGARIDDDKLLVAFDIVEGEYAGYYAKRLEYDRGFADKNGGEVKYKGVIRYYIPKGDGSERDGWNVNKFNRLLGAVAASNAGFVWNWNEQSLVGKSIGVVYREREWEFNGNRGTMTEVGMVCSVADARANKIVLRPRALANSAPKPASTDGFTTTTEELPF